MICGAISRSAAQTIMHPANTIENNPAIFTISSRQGATDNQELCPVEKCAAFNVRSGSSTYPQYTARRSQICSVEIC
jgi:hypothetical protein